mgnify:CR=1 FL=1
MRKLTQTLALLVLTLSLLLGGCAAPVQDAGSVSPSVPASSGTQTSASLDALPAYSGEPYVALNGNEPDFSADEITDTSFETSPPSPRTNTPPIPMNITATWTAWAAAAWRRPASAWT